MICLFALLIFVPFGACRAERTTPEPFTDCSFSAVYSSGEFHFRCHVKWHGGTVYVTVLDTAAAGMTMSCDGREVTLSKADMIRRVPKEDVDATNPARLLWEVFSALQNGGTHTSLGEATVQRDHAGAIEIIDVGGITVTAEGASNPTSEG